MLAKAWRGSLAAIGGGHGRAYAPGMPPSRTPWAAQRRKESTPAAFPNRRTAGRDGDHITCLALPIVFRLGPSSFSFGTRQRRLMSTDTSTSSSLRPYALESRGLDDWDRGSGCGTEALDATALRGGARPMTDGEMERRCSLSGHPLTRVDHRTRFVLALGQCVALVEWAALLHLASRSATSWISYWVRAERPDISSILIAWNFEAKMLEAHTARDGDKDAVCSPINLISCMR
ncbi:hypothetical protein B0H17DRAFT_1202252 [Mycena rosella]|uniref:Uncharacterized protein n=1 Tax=Mycena rosella TaxID=1033263 RepID=A0AAD7GDJ2_MYCRO|nr:hypothetical protein B0H17DRAFT_1202252 [Mycena rosella]